MNAVSFLDFNDAAPQGRAQPASLDREAILSRAKMQLEPLLQMLFPHGKRRGREFVVGVIAGGCPRRRTRRCRGGSSSAGR